MQSLSAAVTGIRKDRDTTVRYEVRRLREPGRGGAARPPHVEEFLGLDRARIAGLGYGLDGSTTTDEQFSGVVQIVQVFYVAGTRSRAEIIDEIDERVAARVLNELRFPRAGEMEVPLSRLQAEIEGLIP